MADVMIERPNGEVEIVEFAKAEEARTKFESLKCDAQKDETIVSLSWSAD